jgi:hypothetical protein
MTMPATAIARASAAFHSTVGVNWRFTAPDARIRLR